MARSRRLERSASSFSYSSYHTLEEVGLLGQAQASVFPVAPQGLLILAEASEGLGGLWETGNWQLGSVEQILGEGPLGRQLLRSRSQDLD